VGQRAALGGCWCEWAAARASGPAATALAALWRGSSPTCLLPRSSARWGSEVGDAGSQGRARSWTSSWPCVEDGAASSARWRGLPRARDEDDGGGVMARSRRGEWGRVESASGCCLSIRFACVVGTTGNARDAVWSLQDDVDCFAPFAETRPRLARLLVDLRNCVWLRRRLVDVLVRLGQVSRTKSVASRRSLLRSQLARPLLVERRCSRGLPSRSRRVLVRLALVAAPGSPCSRARRCCALRACARASPSPRCPPGSSKRDERGSTLERKACARRRLARSSLSAVQAASAAVVLTLALAPPNPARSRPLEPGLALLFRPAAAIECDGFLTTIASVSECERVCLSTRKQDLSARLGGRWSSPARRRLRPGAALFSCGSLSQKLVAHPESLTLRCSLLFEQVQSARRVPSSLSGGSGSGLLGQLRSRFDLASGAVELARAARGKSDIPGRVCRSV